MLEKLSGIDRRFESSLDELREATSVIEELSRKLSRYADGIEFNREHLDELRQRQMLLHRLAKKYAKRVPELIDFRNRLAGELSLDENLSEEIAAIEQQIARERNKLSAEAGSLSSKRSLAATELERAIMENLGKLGIPFSCFQVEMAHEEQAEGDILLDGKRYKALSNGYDRAEFLISTNVGEKPKPLAKVASGGEISRIMLAMKSALAHSAKLPILVFDEIDTGISGPVAQSVGFSLKTLSRRHQIIAITHLPQIAAMADLHLSVRKSVVGQRTVTSVFQLDERERTVELAGLISGSTVSPSSLQLADELIRSGNHL
jgi:DNA repair protein RecN (Recombination protein N)